MNIPAGAGWSERKHQLLTNVVRAIDAAQLRRPLMLLRQREPRRDPLVDTEDPPNEVLAVTFLTAMQEYDVIRKSTRPVEEFADRSQRLQTREVAVAAHDTPLQEPRAPALDLHPAVVVALQGNGVQVSKSLEEVVRNVPEVLS